MKLQYTIIKFLFIVVFLSFNIKAFSQQEDSKVDIQLKELEITASRTQTKLKELPAAVTVISTSSLENNQVRSLSDATSLIPNFYMPDYGSKLTSPVYVRGVGSRTNSPSVALYVDNIPYFEKAAFDFDFFDVKKIELLKGPQGTLFGRNSLGGLINIVTLSPFEYQGTHINVSAGNYGVYRLNAGHYQKINNKLAYSLSANYVHQDGFFSNITRNEKADKMESYGVRLKLQYKITDRWSLDLHTNTDQSTQGGYPYANFDKVTMKIDDIKYNQESGYDRFLLSNAVKLNYRANSWEFSNTLSHQYLNDNQQLDQDFGPDSIYLAGQLQHQNHITDELIFRSKGNKRYQWLTGFFGFVQDVRNKVQVESYKTPTPAGPMFMNYEMNFKPLTSGAAVFHQSSFKILPQLTLTAGIRFDYENTTLQYTYAGKLAGNSLAPVDTIYPALSDLAILPKLAMSYAPTDNLNLYLSYASGYKPGGFNVTFERPEFLKFAKETSHNFEFGVKADLINLLFVETSLFYSLIENQQITRTAPSGRGTYLDNSGLSRNIGGEFSLQNLIYHGFEGLIGYGYTHAEILEYVQSATLNYNNNFTPYIPRETLSIQGTQTFKLNKNTVLDKLKLHLAYNLIGESYWNLSNTLKESKYGLLNGKISFIRKNFQLDFWAKNLTNSTYNAFIFEVGSAAYAQLGKPRQIGLSFSYRL